MIIHDFVCRFIVALHTNTKRIFLPFDHLTVAMLIPTYLLDALSVQLNVNGVLVMKGDYICLRPAVTLAFGSNATVWETLKYR